MLIFEKISRDNTPVALRLAFGKAVELSTDIVLSSSTGASALAALEIANEKNFSGRIAVITSVWGMKGPGENPMPDENRKKLTDAGVYVVTAAHALSGAERSFSNKFNGVYPAEIMAHTLRLFCEGVKVCVEVASMALDAGAIKSPKPVVSLGGTGRGLDTVCVITPGYTAKIFETRIHEVLCKPY